MKRITYLLALNLFLAGLLYSCSSDDNDNVTGSIIGSWKPVKMTMVGTVSQAGVSRPINQTVTVNECQQKSRTVFSADGTVETTSWDDTSSTCQQISTESSSYIYDSNAATLTMKQNGITLTSKILKLNDSECVTEDNLSNFSLGGFIFTGKITTYNTKVN